MAQQTSVEWLIKKLNQQKNILKNHFEAGKWNDDRVSEIDNCLILCEAALEMEKQEKEKCWIAALEYGLKFLKTDENANSKEAFEQYYTQTYGK
jgi:hypothetical protein